MITAIILAAGKSTRMGTGADKAFLSLGNKPVLAWSLLAFERCRAVDRIVLVVRKTQLLAAKEMARMFGISKLQTVLAGGARRQDSVALALAACDPDTRHVLVHDAARPLVKSETVALVAEAAVKHGAVALAHRMDDAVKRVEKGVTVAATEYRERLWAVQTPQGFELKVLRAAYQKLGKAEIVDDAQAVELAGGTVRLVETRLVNFKITTVEDLQAASAICR